VNGFIVAKIEIYTTPICGYCARAKGLLKSKGAAYDEIDVMGDGAKREEMMKRANGRHTVPQIFIDGKHVGGCDDLYELESAGKLDPMLAGT
jgi:glutaredoxin 3